MSQLNRLTCLAALLLMASLSPAKAGAPLTVELDQSQPMVLTGDPGSVIIGNPSIADVSLNGRQLILHGHSFGETNLIVFDTTGNKLVDFDITVAHNTSNQLSVFVASGDKGAARRYTYSCAPYCEANVIVGDAYAQSVVTDTRAKNDLTNGVKTSDLGPKVGGVAPPQ